MTLFRRFVLAIIFALVTGIIPFSAAPLQSGIAPLYAQSSPTETPAPAYAFQVIHVDGTVMKALCSGQRLSTVCLARPNAVRRWEYIPGHWIRRFDSLADSLETVNEGDTLSAGDEIYTGDESGVVLQIGSQTTGAGAGKLVLAQQSALNIEVTGGTAAVPDIHLRLDTGLLATMPGSPLPPEATFEIAVPDEVATNSEPPSGSALEIWGPARILPVRLDKLPAVMVGHDPESGDVVVSVLDGTATLIDGDNQIEIPPESFTVKQKIQDKEGIPPDVPVTMTDQEEIAWVSALRFGDGDPSPFPILAHHLDSDPEPFPVYALVHDQAGDTGNGEHHTLFAPSHTSSTDHHAQADDTHTTADHATEEAHTSAADHHDTTDTTHTDGGHTDTGSHNSGSGEHVEPTEQPHG